jgi:hypothetical protein
MPAQKKAKNISKAVDKEILNCYYQINTDSIPGGESPPAANPSECRPRVTQLGAFFMAEIGTYAQNVRSCRRSVPKLPMLAIAKATRKMLSLRFVPGTFKSPY